MPVVYHENLPSEPFRGGATYQTVVGDEQGSTPVRLGIQTSPPGYRTPLHSHPYMETLMILEGSGEAWIEGHDDLVALGSFAKAREAGKLRIEGKEYAVKDGDVIEFRFNV